MAGTDAPPRWDPYIKAEDLLSWNLFPLLLFAELQCQTFLIVLSEWVGQNKFNIAVKLTYDNHDNIIVISKASKNYDWNS